MCGIEFEVYLFIHQMNKSLDLFYENKSYGNIHHWPMYMAAHFAICAGMPSQFFRLCPGYKAQLPSMRIGELLRGAKACNNCILI